MKQHIKLLLRNMLLLAAGALPLCLVLISLQDLIRGVPHSRGLGDGLETGAFYFLVFVGPVISGGIVHQLVLYLAARQLSPRLHRLASLVLSPLILAVVVLWGQPLDPLLEFLIPIGVSLAVYALLARLPPAAHHPANGSAVG